MPSQPTSQDYKRTIEVVDHLIDSDLKGHLQKFIAAKSWEEVIRLQEKFSVFTWIKSKSQENSKPVDKEDNSIA